MVEKGRKRLERRARGEKTRRERKEKGERAR